MQPIAICVVSAESAHTCIRDIKLNSLGHYNLFDDDGSIFFLIGSLFVLD